MGRGSSKANGGSAGGARVVPYDEWGKEIDNEPIKDENGDTIGYINDETRYISEPYHEKITKKDILNDIDGWRMDDGTYGDEDVSIGLAYNDGSYVDVNALDGKAYRKSGIVGAHITTPDYEMVWGGELNTRTGNIEPYLTHEMDDLGNMIDGYSNSISGYRTTGSYRVRVRTTYNNYDGTRYRTRREELRRSTVREWRR